jgi:multiple sugar transport system substrate-binding protein
VCNIKGYSAWECFALLSFLNEEAMKMENMKSGKLLVLSTLLLCMLVLVACAEESGQTDEAVQEENEGDEGAIEEDANREEDEQDGDNGDDGNDGNDGEDMNTDAEKVELLFQYHREDFDEIIKERVEQQFPHITLEQVNPNEEDMEQLYASGIVPDIIAPSAHVLHHLIDDEIAYNLEELVDQHNFDLNRLEPAFLDFMLYQADGDLLALPFMSGGGSAMYYNKALFDRFAVPYPEDDMTWPEVVELGKQLTREEGGVQYRGLDLDLFSLARNQLEVPPIDVETGQPTFAESEEWLMLMELFKEVYEIPGNYDHIQNPEDFVWNWGNDFLEGNVAIRLGKNTMRWYIEEDIPFEWDVVSYPVWEHNGLAPADFEFALAISRHSEHIDAAWEVIEYLLSDEHQTWLARNGITIPALSDLDIREQFYAEVDDVQEYNVGAFTYNEFATQVQAPPGFPFLRIDQAELQDFLATSHQDPVQYLRELQERGETEIVEFQQQN